MKGSKPVSRQASIRKWRRFGRPEMRLLSECRTHLLTIAGRSDRSWEVRGDRDLSGLCVEGSFRFYFGRRSRRALTVRQGEFVAIPPRVGYHLVNLESRPGRFIVFMPMGAKFESIDVAK